MIRSAHALTVAMTIVLAGCAAAPAGSSQPSTSALPSTSARPVLRDVAGPSFYSPSADAIADAAPGRIIDSIEINAPAGTRAWFVVYGSTGLDGAPVAVSSMILAPEESPGASGYPVVAWAHGTTGIADRCAPSQQGVARGIPAELRSLVNEGYVVAATDYEGLGTAGIHPYLIGTSEGRSVLDSIRAAQALPEAHAGSEAVVIGLSQGGHAALWAAELAPSYAPELSVLGAFAASPPTDMAALERWAFGQAALGSIGPALAPLLLFGVWNDVYGLPLDFLTDAGRQSALDGRDGCYPSDPGDTPYLTDPALQPDWAGRLAENSPGAVRTGVPIRVVSPDADQAVAYETQLAGLETMCRVGDTVELQTVSGEHDKSLFSATAWPAAVSWIADRFAGLAPISTC